MQEQWAGWCATSCGTVHAPTAAFPVQPTQAPHLFASDSTAGTLVMAYTHPRPTSSYKRLRDGDIVWGAHIQCASQGGWAPHTRLPAQQLYLNTSTSWMIRPSASIAWIRCDAERQRGHLSAQCLQGAHRMSRSSMARDGLQQQSCAPPCPQLASIAFSKLMPPFCAGS